MEHPKAVIILIPGYETAFGGKPLMLGHAEYLQKNSYSTLLLDPRSVGQSEGNTITLGVHEWKDAVAAYEYLSSLPENKQKKVGFLGISLGAVTSIIATGESNKGDFIIASVPFASYQHLFRSQIHREHLWTPLFLPLLRLAALCELGFRYDTYAPIQEIANVHVPIFLISAKEDEEVFSTDAQDLYQQAHQPKEYWQANTSHDVFKYYGSEFQKRVLTFLEQYVKE